MILINKRINKFIYTISSILVIIYIFYIGIKDPHGLGPLYENNFDKCVIDSVYYGNNHRATIKLNVGNRDIVFASFTAKFGVDLCEKLKKGDTLFKQKDSYDFYRINGNQIDTFKYIGTENFLEIIGWNKKSE
jgi:hypothetical protein